MSRPDFAGFDPAKVEAIDPFLGPARRAIERLVGRRLDFPPVRMMTRAEISRGRKIRGPGHEGGAGHGLFDGYSGTVAINKTMGPLGILANFVHENLHFALPGMGEVEIDRLTDEILIEIGAAEPIRRRNKMFNVLHSSDLHGNWKEVLRFKNFDVWIDSGDFFPNKTRGTPEEKRYQTRWFANKRVGERLTEWLAGRPLISVSGNHDYVSLTKLMREAGAKAYEVTPKGVTVDGIHYAGFRHVPYIFGEWAGETHQGDFPSLVDEVFEVPPDILVTHSGPADILSGGDRYHGGINSLASALSWRPHTIKAHFFGHDHEFGSQTKEEVGVIFSNSATKPKIVHIDGLQPAQKPVQPRRKRRPRKSRRDRG